MPGLTSTIVISSYNGSRYIKEQLESLRTQTLAPSCVVICDDCSTDNTREIVRDYIDSHGLRVAGWTLASNAVNLGWKKSFRNLILGAETDLIFPCDQDDIWSTNKIELMTSLMESHEDVNLLASLVDPFYEKGSQRTAAAKCGKRKGSVIAIEIPGPKSMYIQRPGCSYCVRSAFVREIESLWRESYPHDAMLWRYAAFTHSLGLLDMPLVRFRRHDSNASSRKRADATSRLAEIAYYQGFAEELCMYLSQLEGSESEVQMLGAIGDWLQLRQNLIASKQWRNILPISHQIGFYATPKSFVVDMVCAMGLSL